MWKMNLDTQYELFAVHVLYMYMFMLRGVGASRQRVSYDLFEYVPLWATMDSISAAMPCDGAIRSSTLNKITLRLITCSLLGTWEVT